MAFHKRVKFPFEVTKGKAADLYKLKFMRKSEFDPTLRHTLRHNVRQMGKQLDIWYKEQSFTLGSLSREQDKLYISRKRLKKEQRRIKKRDYAEYQEEIRQKLYGLREKMIMMKVVQKFRDNVVRNKHQRLQEVEANAPTKGTTSANGTSLTKSKIASSDASFKTTAGDVTDVDDATDYLTNKGSKKVRAKRYRPEKGTPTNTAKSSTDTSHTRYEPTPHSKKDVTVISDGEHNHTVCVVYRSDNEGDLDDEDEAASTGTDLPAGFGQRYPSSHGARMETILEELGEEVEVEMDDDTTAKDHVKLTRQRLRQFNRSHCKKNIFADSQQVPLLPDLNFKLASLPGPGTVRSGVDKGTQTSINSKRPRRKDPRDKVKGKRKTRLIVKLPGQYEDPATSDHSNYGSDSDSDLQFEDTGDTGYGDDETDDIYGGVVSNVGIYSDISGTGGYESCSERSDDDSLDDVFVDTHVKRSLELNSCDRGEKIENVTSQLRHKHNCPEEVKLSELPSLRGIKLQNPYNLEYKERSFFLKPNIDESRSIGSARTQRSCDQNREFIHSRQKRRGNNRETQTLVDIKEKRITEIKEKMTRDYVKMNISSDVDIAVFGKKANSFLKKRNTTPPNTPNVGASNEAAKRSPRGHIKVAVNKKREQEMEREKLHQLVCSEPVQKYERTRSGRLLPMGPPRVSSHDRLPTMKDRYYREKLLKAERVTTVSQNIKMKKFMDMFDKERDPIKLPPIAGSSSARTDASAAGNTGKTFSNIVFKVYKPEQDLDGSKKVLTPEVSSSSLSMLRNCRYLREYRPAMGVVEKETSWKMKSAGSAYTDHYIPKVRLLHLD